MASGQVLRYVGRRRGSIWGKLFGWAIKIGRKVGTQVAKQGSKVTKVGMRNLANKAKKEVLKKITDPKTLRKVVQSGVQGGIEHLAEKKKREREQVTIHPTKIPRTAPMNVKVSVTRRKVGEGWSECD